MRFLTVLALLSFLGSGLCQAQPFSAFTNVRQEFYVFDNGAMVRLEGFLPTQYKVGRSAVAYLDNQRVFKVYRDGATTTVNDQFTSDFNVSDNLVLYRSANAVSVIDGGDVVLLSRLCDRYALGDSVVLFYDLNRQTFNGYYNGKITEMEAFMNIGSNDFKFDSTVKASDNIGAYINYNDQFKVFYNNQVETLEAQAVKEFQTGRNTVGYVDINNIFKVYHKGHVYTLDPFRPTSFHVGDDLVAFVSYDGYFKIFYDGNLYTIGFYEPRYRVADRVVAFADPNGFFKVFYEGEQTTLDNYFPEKMEIGYHSVAYVNKANVLRMFSKGKVYDITTMGLYEMRLDYDVLQYKIGFNAYKLFYNGEYYN